MKKVLIAWMLVASGAAQAQSFAAGQAKYQKGDFVGAERAYAQALTTEKDAGDRVRLLKYLGICQYMRAAHKEAFLTFKELIALSPGTKIASVEVLDDSVVSFYERVKQITMAQSTQQQPAAPVAAAAPVPAKAPAEPPKMDGSKSEPKKTLLVVSSNIPEAAVMIEGIIAGKVGQPLNVNPGKLNVEVLARGYASTQQVVDVARDQQTKVYLKLEKPVAEKPKAKVKDTALVVKSVDVFADEQTAKRRKARTASNDKGLVTELAKDGKQQRKAAGAKRRAAKANLAAAVDRDAPAAAKPQQQPLPPQYYAAYPAMSQPMAMQNTAPATHSTVVAILPFGAGQFQNGNPLLGSVFAVAEVGALYYYFDRTKEANTAAKERDDFTRGRDEATFTQDELDYVDNRAARAKANKQQSTLALASFASLWLAGAVEAILSTPDVSTMGQPGMMPSSPYYRGQQQQPNARPKRAANDGAPQFSLAPVETAPESNVPGLALQANWKF